MSTKNKSKVNIKNVYWINTITNSLKALKDTSIMTSSLYVTKQRLRKFSAVLSNYIFFLIYSSNGRFPRKILTLEELGVLFFPNQVPRKIAALIIQHRKHWTCFSFKPIMLIVLLFKKKFITQQYFKRKSSSLMLIRANPR